MALTGIAQHLADLGALKPGVSVAQAVDTLWFYFGQNAWCSLIGEREWTFDQAEQWLREAASRDLLRETGPSGADFDQGGVKPTLAASAAAAHLAGPRP